MVALLRSSSNSGNGTPVALLYRRVSGDEQEREGVSLPAQQAECLRYTAAHGWVPGSEFEDVLTGKRDDRPGYQELLSEVRRLRAERRNVVVVVSALDRFGRRLLERARAAEEFEKLGVALHSIREGGVMPPLAAGILAAVAEDEVRRTGIRVRETWANLRRNGWHHIGRAPYGYVQRSATEAERAQGAPKAVLDVDPIAAPIVKDAYERAAAAEPIRGIARWLADLPSEVRRGRQFSMFATNRMLRAAVYVSRDDAGLDIADPEAVLAAPAGHWPALLTDHLWLAVRRRVLGHRRVPRQASGRFLLTGLLWCPACGSGSRMVGHQDSPPRYGCSSRNLGNGKCNWTADQRRVDALVLAEVGALLDGVPQLAKRPEVQQAWRRLQQPENTEERARRVAQLERQRDTAKRRLADAATLLIDGSLDRTAYAAVRERFDVDLRSAEDELGRLLRERPASSRLPSLEAVMDRAGAWTQILTGAPVPQQREVLAELVERIVPERPRRREYEIHVTWSETAAALKRLVQELGY